MGSLTAHFDVPSGIEEGLRTSSLERVGGVIRRTNDSRIVAWLRETGSPLRELPGPPRLSSALGLANLATSIVSLGVTRSQARAPCAGRAAA